MDLGLKGKKGIVTAASKGLGRAVALRLAEEGVELAICARGLESLRRTEEDIYRVGGRVFSAATDVSEEKGIQEFVASSADELAPESITVNTVCPGFTLTDRLKEYMASIAKRENKSVEEVMSGFSARIPMRRLAEPENIADVVVFLASDRASYLTGLCIPVDGGASRTY